MTKIVSWSHSAINSYKTCPFKHYQTKVLKRVKEVMGPEAQEGVDIHKKFELRLLNKIPLTGVLAQYEALCKKIEEAPGVLHPETSFALTRSFQKTHFKDWDNAWFRGTIDVLKVNGKKAWVGDWKTGKVKDDDSQLELFAGVVFIFYPEVEEVKANYIWLKQSSFSSTLTFTRDKFKDIWAKHVPDALELERAHAECDWPTRTSGLCKEYCDVRKAGLCPEFPGKVV